MRKNIQIACAMLLIITAFIARGNVMARSAINAPAFLSASELIDAVNQLRATYGLAPYQANSILNGIAQAHAEYLVSIGTITHTSANGMRPFQRALAAGYLVAGDLSLGGFFSENITAGVGMTAQEAVQQWMGDDPHKNTMLSGTLQDVGAGVGVYGNTFYYVLDAGLSTGGTPVVYTPPPPLYPSTSTIVPNTPNADGSIVHTVQRGDTLGSLSLAYNAPLADILKLNGLTIKSTIYIGQKIIIRAAYTPTPTQPTPTPTILPTATLWPTSTPSPTSTDIPPTPTPSPGLPIPTAGGAVSAIVVSALILAALIALISRKRK